MFFSFIMFSMNNGATKVEDLKIG